MMPTIQEELLHYIWHTKAFDLSDLRLTDGRTVEILHFGYHNHHDGPDFSEAKINIAGTTWAGHVEMHLKSSDWYAHHHEVDTAYDNVILHVVLKDDATVTRSDQSIIPCLALHDRISSKLIATYQHLLQQRHWIPCEPFIHEVNTITKSTTFDRMLAERLTQKANDIKHMASSQTNNLNEVIYQRLAWAMGLKANANAMLQLAQKVPYQLVRKHQDQPFILEALYFGASGLLPQENDNDYVQSLLREYNIYSTKYNISSLSKVQWKFAKLRPPGFPTIRIAQFCQVIRQIDHLDILLHDMSIEEMRDIFSAELQGYWETHYGFGEASEPRPKRIGKKRQDILIANAIVPLLYYHGLKYDQQASLDRAVDLLSQLPAEHNSITERWKDLNMNHHNMADTQALLQLKKHHCDQHRCLSCAIGHKVLHTT